MAHFPDLSPHTYSESPVTTLTVGWLDGEHPYPTGELLPGFRDELVQLLLDDVNVYRGYHHCQLCEVESPIMVDTNDLGRQAVMGHSEVHVTDGDLVYAAPTLVVHYIDAHGYCPPEQFQRAVLAHPRHAEFVQQGAWFTWSRPAGQDGEDQGRELFGVGLVVRGSTQTGAGPYGYFFDLQLPELPTLEVVSHLTAADASLRAAISHQALEHRVWPVLGAAEHFDEAAWPVPEDWFRPVPGPADGPWQVDGMTLPRPLPYRVWPDSLPGWLAKYR